MADNLRMFTTNRIETKDIGQQVDEMVTFAKNKRKGFERRWYDNNFFDDGHHFRYLSRSSNKIVDLSERATIYAPQRAIPKASRQIRGIANLLVAPDYVPIIFPEKVDPNDQNAYQQAKDVAHKTGRWMMKEWEEQDLIEKIAFMVILACKHSVSWMEIWPDPVDEAIKTQVYDAFDIMVMGDLTDPEDSPFLAKVTKQLISKIKANERFDKTQLDKITPDNKQASSEIKDAYMNAKFSNLGTNDNAASLLLKEAYVKEYINEDNVKRIRSQKDGGKILEHKKEGDQVIRQTYVAGNIWLADTYVDLPSYPFVDLRLEPGPIYSVPLIERFIPINKSLDMLVSRAERFSHTMVTGIYAKKKGESFDVANTPGGQVIEYNGAPPTQMNIASIPGFYFELLGLMGNLIEEQGLSTTLGQIPTGVKAHSAIESLKEQEYGNLVIASRRLRTTVKKIAERMLDIADSHFIKPQTVYDMKDGNPQYFDVIGSSAMEKRQQVGLETPPNVIPLKKDYKVEIEVQQGLAYTKEGQKAAAKELGDYMIQLAQLQLVNPEMVKVYVQKLFEVYQFGPTEELMEAMDSAGQTQQLSQQQMMQMQMAVLQALKDAGEVGQEASDKRVQETKVGVVEALKDTGLIDGKPANPKDQIEIEKIAQEMQMEKEQHDLEMQKMEQELKLAEQEAELKQKVTAAQATQGMQLKEQTTKANMRIKEKTSMIMAKQQKGGNTNGKSTTKPSGRR